MTGSKDNKTLVVTTMFDHGGVTAYWKDAVNALGADAEWLFFVNEVPGVDPDPFKRSNVKVSKGFIWNNPFASSWTLTRDVRSFAPQTVIFNATLAIVRLLPAILFLRVLRPNIRLKCVFHNGAIYQKPLMDFINRTLVSFTCKLIHKNIFVSQFVSRYWWCSGVVISRPFAPQARPSFSHEKTLKIGFLGRISPEKDPELFLQAMEIVRTTIKVDTEIAGLGSLKDTLEKKFPWAHWRGWVQSQGWLESIDLLITSSKTEGWPIAIGEALERGVPTIGTDVGGVREVVGEKNSQWLIKSRKPSDLATLIVTFLKDYTENSELYFQRTHKSTVTIYDWALRLISQ